MNQRILLCLMFAVTLAAPSHAAETIPQQPQNVPPQPEWALETSPSYASGDFGTSTTTNTLYWPVTIRRYVPRGEVAFTIPYIDQTAGPGVTAIRGRPLRTDRSTAGPKRSDSGIGDLLLDGRYHFFDETTEAFKLSGFGGLKLPTADEDKRLGTGEFDQTLGLESGKALDELWSVHANVYYTFIGDPPDTDLNDQFLYDLGLGYKLTEKTLATVSYQESTALVDDEDNAREIVLGANHDLASDTKAYGKTAFGLSDGSPDWALMGGLAYIF